MKRQLFSVKHLLVVLTLLFLLTPLEVAAQNGAEQRLFLPIVTNRFYSGFSAERKFIGIYMQQYWTKQAVDSYLPQANNLAGKKHSVVGWFIDIEDVAFTPPIDITVNNFYVQLEALWQAGYISFVNLNSGSATAYDIASGEKDPALSQLADIYAQWVGKGGGRRAFLAPLQEMNGVRSDGSKWTSYAGDPGNFKLAFRHIRDIFRQKGVERQVWWTFAPNGWSPDAHKFEYYYPGNDVVDVLAFSSYNFGYCAVAAPWYKWENYDTLFDPYIERMQAMAPLKPIIIAQTGTTAQYSQTGVYNNGQKNQWLANNYKHLAAQPAVIGILYYDLSPEWECDWAITQGGPFDGYKTGVADPTYQYLTIQDLQGMGF